ncbi:MAG: biotin--[acetyl-CoA-carboxylase] ligase [Kiritimatiellae bacterium]|nr:biotin--[acetyl-CoA-carboxylase] ligase [Kiritimatiellia bacterium]
MKIATQLDISRDLESKLSTTTIGRTIKMYDEVESTMDIAKEFARIGEPEGLVIAAQTQHKGRGRRDKTWMSIPGRGVYASILLRLAWPGKDTSWFALLGGVAIACTLENFGLKNVTLKWPNDVLVHGRKIAGVLVEPRVGNKNIDFVVLGVGINVLYEEKDFPESLKSCSTSCLLEGDNKSCETVMLGVLTQLDEWYSKLKNGHRDELLKAWCEQGGIAKIPSV